MTTIHYPLPAAREKRIKAAPVPLARRRSLRKAVTPWSHAANAGRTAGRMPA